MQAKLGGVRGFVEVKDRILVAKMKLKYFFDSGFDKIVVFGHYDYYIDDDGEISNKDFMRIICKTS